MSDEIRLRKGEKREVLGGSHVISDMPDKAKFLLKIGSLDITGVTERSSLIIVIDGQVEITKDAHLRGELRVKGDVILNGTVDDTAVIEVKGKIVINSSIARNAVIDASKIIIGEAAEVYNFDYINAKELIISRNSGIAPATSIKGIKKLISIGAGVVIRGNNVQAPTIIKSEGDINLAAPIQFFADLHSKPIIMEGKNILGEGVDFHGTKFHIETSLEAQSLTNCSVNYSHEFQVGKPVINVTAGSATNTEISLVGASLNINAVTNCKITSAEELNSVVINGGNIVTEKSISARTIAGKAKILTVKLDVVNIAEQANINATEEVIAANIGGGAKIHSAKLEAGNIMVCTIEVTGNVDAKSIEQGAKISAHKVYASDNIDLKARIKAKEIYIGGELAALGSWPEGIIDHDKWDRKRDGR